MEGRFAVGVRTRAAAGRPVYAFGHPYLVARISDPEGILEVGESILPGAAVVAAGSVLVYEYPAAFVGADVNGAVLNSGFSIQVVHQDSGNDGVEAGVNAGRAGQEVEVAGGGPGILGVIGAVVAFVDYAGGQARLDDAVGGGCGSAVVADFVSAGTGAVAP